MSGDHKVDDDCPICRAMRDGSANTMGGLMNAFEEAKKQGAIVGGEYFDKKNRRSNKYSQKPVNGGGKRHLFTGY